MSGRMASRLISSIRGCAVSAELPLSTKFAIRQALDLLAESRKHFRSRRASATWRLLAQILKEVSDAIETPRSQPSGSPPGQATLGPAGTTQHHGGLIVRGLDRSSPS